MRIFRDTDDPGINTPTILTFGVFDGLHLGHQLIMRQVVERARSTGLAATAVTFDPHPRSVVHPETVPLLLQTLEQRIEGLDKLGIDQTIVLQFTEELSRVSAEAFLLDTIFGRLDAREVYLGHGFAFGHGREGKFELLKQVAGRLGRAAVEVPEVLIRGRRISSTNIRRLLGAGRVNLARRMLGRPYGLAGRVVEGRKLGESKLGYATANLKLENCVVPGIGVYVTLALADGRWRQSITNVGHRPTFGSDADLTVETHIMKINGEFDLDLYGKELRVRFLHRLRGEMRFESAEALREQIGRDYRRALKYFGNACVRRNLEFV